MTGKKGNKIPSGAYRFNLGRAVAKVAAARISQIYGGPMLTKCTSIQAADAAAGC